MVYGLEYCTNLNILLAYDGSSPADHALETVLERFDPDVVTALYVFDPSEAGYDAPDPFGSDGELDDIATERAVEVLSAVEETVPDDIEVRTVHEVGAASRGIVRRAEAEEIEHVAIGSHGRDGVSRLLLGSVAETVVRRSPVPVTVVR